MAYDPGSLVRRAPDDQVLTYMTQAEMKRAEHSFGRAFLHSLALAGAFALVGPRLARAENPAGKAGNDMERKGNAQEKAADAEKAKGKRLEKKGDAMEDAGDKHDNKAQENAGKKT